MWPGKCVYAELCVPASLLGKLDISQLAGTKGNHTSKERQPSTKAIAKKHAKASFCALTALEVWGKSLF